MPFRTGMVRFRAGLLTLLAEAVRAGLHVEETCRTAGRSGADHRRRSAGDGRELRRQRDEQRSMQPGRADGVCLSGGAGAWVAAESEADSAERRETERVAEEDEEPHCGVRARTRSTCWKKLRDSIRCG